MKPETVAVHAGDRRKAGAAIPVTTPIYTAASYIYEDTDTLDRVFGREVDGDSYQRYENPTNRGLEAQLAMLEKGGGALACSSGMAALQIALQAALTDARKHVVAASALYGASINMLRKVFEPLGVETTFVDICDLEGVSAAVEQARPGCVVMETVSNPLLRVGAMEAIAGMAHKAGAALVVDNTFATPLMVRPLEVGAHFVVHSLTKYLSGHGDVLGGAIIADVNRMQVVRELSRTAGPVLGPFESYLCMRGVKTFPLRYRRQCENAERIAGWLRRHDGTGKVHYTGFEDHPDRDNIERLFAPGLRGAMISFELKDAGKPEVFAFMDRLRLVVRATSLGDVHTMLLYPAISSHRDLAPKHRQRLGIGDNLVRLSVGIEAPEDIIDDLKQAFSA